LRLFAAKDEGGPRRYGMSAVRAREPTCKIVEPLRLTLPVAITNRALRGKQ
jgi:hypothetical protein